MGADFLAFGAIGAGGFGTGDFEDADPAEGIEDSPQRTEITAKEHGDNQSAKSQDTEDDVGNDTDCAVTETGEDEIVGVVTTEDEFTGAIGEDEEKDQDDIAQDFEPAV